VAGVLGARAIDRLDPATKRWLRARGQHATSPPTAAKSEVGRCAGMPRWRRPGRLCERRCGEAAGSLVHLWSRRPLERQLQSKLL